jgi:hypothetical protein
MTLKTLYTHLKYRHTIRKNVKRAMKEMFPNGAYDTSMKDLDGLGLIVDDGVETHNYDSLTRTTYHDVDTLPKGVQQLYKDAVEDLQNNEIGK